MQLQPNAETPTAIRRRNRFAVMSFLRDHGPLSKTDLVRLTDRTNTTISTILEGLLDEGLVDEWDQGSSAENGRGRPAAIYRLSSERWLVAGIQIASNAVTGVIMRLDGVVVASQSMPAPADMRSRQVLVLAGDLLAELIASGLSGEQRLLGIGLALEGFVDTTGGISRWMLFRKEWEDVAVATYFRKRFSLPVFTDYRVYAATLAEAAYGEARGVNDFAYLNIDTAVATGFVASGTLVRTSQDPAGITGGLGHVLRTDSTTPCFCGNVGCLHNEITTHSLVEQLKEILALGRGHGMGSFWQNRELTFDNLIEAARQGDGFALQLRHRFARNLGIAVAATIQLFSANLVIVGGPPVLFGGDEAIEAARRSAERLTILHPLFGTTRVVASRLLPDPATVGAATLVVHAVMEGPLMTPQPQG